MKQRLIFVTCLLLLIASCSVSYKFTGTTINYDVIKTVNIKEFPNHAQLVYPPLSQSFTEAIRHKYLSQTRLKTTGGNADLELEGEIVGYETTDVSVKEDGFASQTRLTMSVKVRFVNNKNPTDDLDQTFSAYREYPNTQSLDQVQDQLLTEIISDLTDEIFNATLGNW